MKICQFVWLSSFFKIKLIFQTSAVQSVLFGAMTYALMWLYMYKLSYDKDFLMASDSGLTRHNSLNSWLIDITSFELASP
jgi:hypothetical protein